MSIALDATYGFGEQLTGVGVYCREILYGLSQSHLEQSFVWMYRPHKFVKSWRENIPDNCRRSLLLDGWPTKARLFHGLNQRVPAWRAPRTLSTFHDLFVMTGEYSSPEFRNRFKQLASDATKRSDLIVAVSQFTANQVHELLGVERSRLRVVHHGVRMPVPKRLDRERIVLHVGAIQKRKNIARLIEAFRILPDNWRLVLAGSAGFGADEVLAKKTERVHVTGYLTAGQLDDLYQRASIFAFPSLDEGFGIPVLEAMANEIPVIASNTSALPEVCADAAILVDPRGTEEIAAQLRRLTSDEDLRNELIRRGLARAKQFPWSAAVQKTWAVYNELA